MGRTWSLARQLFALQAAVVALVLAGAAVAVYVQFSDTNQDATAEEMLGISRRRGAAAGRGGDVVGQPVAAAGHP